MLPLAISADVYHNYYNHILLFSPDHPKGRELLKLGIDVGNVDDWSIQGNTLFLRTIDSRDPAQPRMSAWSLDISNALHTEFATPRALRGGAGH